MQGEWCVQPEHPSKMRNGYALHRLSVSKYYITETNMGDTGMGSYIEVGEDWMVDTSHLDHDTLFVSDLLGGVSINIRRTKTGIEVRTYLLPDLEAKHFVTVETGE